MATTKNPESSQNLEMESQLLSQNSSKKPGGWITFPFISVCLMGISIAQSGVTSNFIVYLIKEFSVKNIDAAQIFNIFNGCMSLAPVAGAIISDSYFGCYLVIVVSVFLSFLGMIIMTLTATLPSLRPSVCTPGSAPCAAPSGGQFAILAIAMALISIGMGGQRFNMATMGANQFDRARDQDVFFNWYFCVMYAASILGATVVVYVQDNVSWGMGFGLCAATNAVAFVGLIVGKRFYRQIKSKGSPFSGLARVVVAAVVKCKMTLSSVATDYYHGIEDRKVELQAPTPRFSFLNKAALKADGDTNNDGSVAKPWRLCTVEQVEDLKSILTILPLWSTGIFLAISIGIQASLTVLQALAVDRTVGHHFSIPAGSVSVSMLATVALVLPLFDRAIFPTFEKIFKHNPTPLQRIGIGHILNILAMVASALIEWRRLSLVQAHNLADKPNSVVPMSVLWLVLPFIIIGLGEALHFPGQVALYYQEFPMSLRSTSTAMIALIVALGFYLSTAVVDLVRRTTDWLPDNINAGKMDNVYWMLAVVGVLNFGFYILCAKLYKCKEASEKVEDHEEPSSRS